MKLQNVRIDANCHLCLEPGHGNGTSWRVNLGRDLYLILVTKHVAAPFWLLQDRCDGIETLAKGYFGNDSCSVKLKTHTIHVDGWDVFVERNIPQPSPIPDVEIDEDLATEEEEWPALEGNS